MSMQNHEIAERLSRLANLLAIEGAHGFRVRAYRDAARVIGSLTTNVTDLVNRGKDLSQLPNIDQDLAAKIETLVRTGHFPLLDEVESRTPGTLSDLMRVAGLGPKRVKALHDELGVTTLEDLHRIIDRGELRRIRGFGVKSEETVKARLDTWHHANTGSRRRTAVPMAVSERTEP